jgi:hypothetical protein
VTRWVRQHRWTMDHPLHAHGRGLANCWQLQGGQGLRHVRLDKPFSPSLTCPLHDTAPPAAWLCCVQTGGP